MKVTLEFDLPEEDDEMQTAINAGRYRSLVMEVDQQLRSWLKHDNNFDTPEDALQASRMCLSECLTSYNIEL